MKITTTIFLILFYLVSFSQTRLDSLVLVKINEYRISKGIPAVMLSDVNCNAAIHHSKYLIPYPFLKHTEDTLVTVKDRVIFYGGDKETLYGENITFVSKNYQSNDIMIDDKLANEIVDSWKKSKNHNKILLDKRFKFAGVGTIVENNNVNIKNWINLNATSTLVMTN